MDEPTQATPDQPDAQSGAKLVPVAECIKYRRRAQEAETRLAELEQTLAETRTQVERRTQELATAEAQRDEKDHQLTVAANRAAADRMLAEAGVVDLDVGSLLLAQRVDLEGEVESEALRAAVSQLLVDKPFLVPAPAGGLPPRTASEGAAAGGVSADLARAAEAAAASGDRRRVAEYLRLRRRAAGASAADATSQRSSSQA